VLRVLLTRPPLPAVSGVSAFYRAVEHHIAREVEIVPVDIGSLTPHTLHPLRDQLNYRAALKKPELDLVHLNPSLTARSLYRDGLFFRWAKQRDLPVLVHIHGWEHHTADRIDSGPLGKLFRSTLAGGDAFVVLAEEFRARLLSWGVKAEVHLGTTAVDNSLVEGFSIDEKLDRFAPGSAIRVLFLARIEMDKGIYETIEACSRLVAEGLPIHLTVAGDGSELDNVKALAAEKLGSSVSFLGFILGEEKTRALRDNDIYVLPTSHAEGMPASVLEALALGLPVITRPMGGLKDFFKDGEHGYLMDDTDPSTVASCVRKLATDESLWKSMSGAAHSYATGRFLGSHVAAHLVRVYGTITGGDA
jgi:glycosyltransferase involved in cell wall biosynthesis